MKIILLDIEGTTTPIDFVHKTLFPFAKAKIGEFVEANFNEMKSEIAQLKIEHAKETDYSEIFDENLPESVSNYLKFLIEVDRKSTPLKSLQGKIWQQGYEAGLLKGEVFADVLPAFKRWKAEGKTIAIFSSGSVLAQKLIFGYSTSGDLTPFISNYFDTNIGAKREAESYRKIAAQESFPQVENFLFISDIVEELDASKEAGMKTLLSIREGNAPFPESVSHTKITSFDEV